MAEAGELGAAATWWRHARVLTPHTVYFSGSDFLFFFLDEGNAL